MTRRTNPRPLFLLIMCVAYTTRPRSRQTIIISVFIVYYIIYEPRTCVYVRIICILILLSLLCYINEVCKSCKNFSPLSETSGCENTRAKARIKRSWHHIQTHKYIHRRRRPCQIQKERLGRPFFHFHFHFLYIYIYIRLHRILQ